MENEKNKVEVALDPEHLIQWIEEFKISAYGSLGYIERINDDPEIRKQIIAEMFGFQYAMDKVIEHIRELQGRVAE